MEHTILNKRRVKEGLRMSHQFPERDNLTGKAKI